MSTLNKILNLFFTLFLLTIAAQQNVDKKLTVIEVDLLSKKIAQYNISNDSMSASFNFYLRNYECKNKREEAVLKFKKNTSFTSPSFIISFSATRMKTIDNLDGLEVISLKEFVKGDFRNATPCYIAYKYKNKYVMWQAVALPEE